MEMHEKMALLGPLLRGLKGLGKMMWNHKLNVGLPVLMTGVTTGADAVGGLNRAALAEMPDVSRSITQFGQAMAKGGSADVDQIRAEVANYVSRSIDPIQGVKYAMMMLCDDSDNLLKMARVDHQAATYSAMTKLAEDLNRFPEPEDEAFSEDEKKDVKKVVEFKTVAKPAIKKAMALLRHTFPELYADSNAKIAFVAYLTRPEVMVKTSYFQTSPSTFARYGMPIAAMATLASGILGTGAILNSANGSVSKLTSYAKLVAVDPELANYPEDRVKKIIYDLYKVAPDVMKNDTLASNIVHQLVASPPGGVSIDYADKLLRAQQQLSPEYGDKFVRVLGPASSMVKSVLDVI